MTGKTVYILLFRGVGGATQLPTAPLRAALSEAGFENVATYINSGNAIVRSRLARKSVIATVAKLANEKFGFTKAIHAPTLEEWAELIANNPFPEGLSEPKYLHAALLKSLPETKNVEAIRAYAKPGEQIVVVGSVAYIHTPGGFGVSKMAERFDKLIGVENTARNWNSVAKLHELARIAAEN